MMSWTADLRAGLFVTVEGGEGAGKSTVVALVADQLRIAGVPVTVTREPGQSSIGPAIRALLLDGQYTLTDRAETLLLLAERAQHVSEVIAPALARGDVVLCDRFVDSTAAYQGFSRGLGTDRVRRLSEWASAGLQPDLTFLLDIAPQVGLGRKDPGEVNRMEREPLAFHERVRQGFLSLALHEPARVTLLDGDRPAAETADIITAAIVSRRGDAGPRPR